ncbi:MAG: choice-of-anchor D domain-containing protein, partial [Candidatus Kapaibacterium sp.]
MTIVRYALLPILLLALLCNGRRLSAQPAGSGRSFILTQPFFSPSSRGGSPFARLFVSSRTATTVTLTYLASGQAKTFNVAANSSVERLLDVTQMMLPESEGIFRKSIQLTSTEPITAALLLDQEFATEGYNAIPDNLLGFEYQAISSDAAREGSVLAIIGINDSTNVTITPNVITRGGRGANVPFTVLLNRGDVFQLLTIRDADVDITGSSVVADKPCGFLSGAACAFLPYGFRFSTDFTCNPLTEQIPNSDSWGKEFLVSPLPNEDVGLCRIVAGCDSTSVVIGGKEIAKLNKGGFFEFNPAIVQPVTTSHPALLVQMVTNSAHSFSDLNSPNGDPASMVIAPKNQWGTAFTMVAPNLLPRKDDVGGLGEFVPWKYFIHLTFPESAEEGILIDGVAPAWTFRNANGGFVCGIKEITPGFHSVDSRDPICADGYGRSISDAFAYTLGGVQHPYALTASDDIDISTCDDQADTVITLHNYGSGPVTILSQSFIGRADGEILDPAVPFILAPGGDTVVHLRFKHLRDSSVNGYLIGHGGDCDQRLYAVHLRAGASVITTMPPPGSLFSLGFLPPTVTSHDSTFTITNTGNIPLTVNPPVFSKPEFSIVSPAFPLPISPHGSVTITIRYTPIVEGPSDGSVLFTVAACSDTVRLNLTGSWKHGGQIGYTPAAPIALLCPPKPADTLRVEIANIGDFPYTIFSAAIAGADADEFRLLTALANLTLAPGDKKIVEILYTPGRVGPRNAALHLVTNAILGDTLIPLSVRNDAISLQSTASAIDFGLTSACTPSPSIPFGLLNTGSVRIDHISVALGSSSIGQVTPVSFDSLAAGATANFTVGLSLTAVGTIEDSIVITVPQCNYSLTIPIRAIRAPSSISFTADTLDLGTLSPCEADRQRSIYLRNASQVLDTITLARGSGSRFSVVGFNGPLYLQPGDSAELRINFTPTGTGTFIDSVTMIDSPCGIQRTLILRAS